MFPGVNGFDAAIMEFVQTHLHTAATDAFFVFLTELGECGALWVAVALLLLFFRRTRATGICALASLFCVLLIGELLLKNIVARPRPCDTFPALPLCIPRPTGYSFPSSHAGSSFAAAVSVFLREKKAGTAALVLAALIAFSRVLFLAHYPTDVLAGAALGTASAIFVYAVWNRISAEKLHRPTEK